MSATAAQNAIAVVGIDIGKNSFHIADAMVGLASKLRPRARTLQAVRASLLARAIARTLRCSRFLAASIHGLSSCRSQHVI